MEHAQSVRLGAWLLILLNLLMALGAIWVLMRMTPAAVFLSSPRADTTWLALP